MDQQVISSLALDHKASSCRGRPDHSADGGPPSKFVIGMPTTKTA
jgi:hypothetical protein